jgi:AraC-like DNA-binding protein
LINDRAGEAHLRLGDISAAVGVSKWHLERALKTETGRPFLWHLHHARIGRAKKLLGDELRSIKEIAAITGYDSSTSFGRRFKHDTGMTPSEWRTHCVVNANVKF